ncbi:hypothetical protein OG21DRAFT_1503860 [Imleria badia]|nr:hypothetical protein OG21DRAFT_1503860 [Imleria badia]
MGPPPAPKKAPSETQDPAQSKKDKPRPKRKKTSTPIDTDNERAARLADRRERKKKKRAIVNPPQKHDGTTAPEKGRAKAKKPAALALLYGFSATNVTKERLTLKPAPSLGVFSKGRASAKKKVIGTKKSSSKNEIFSESTFLNKPSARAADDSKVDDDSDDGSISSVSNHPTPQATRITDRTKKDRGKCTETTTPQASTRTTADSEVWDIELQSKLPSSAGDVSSEPGANDSVPVVLDLRVAGWSASVEEHEERCNKTNLSVTRSQSRGPSVVRSPISDLQDELGLAHAPSIHPSHSASQVGRRAADIQRSEVGHVASKYFTEPEPVSTRELGAHPPQIWRSNGGHDALDFRIPDHDVEMDVETIPRVASPINSLISGAQPMAEFQTWQTRYDVVPLEFPSDCSPDDDFYPHVEPLAGRGHDGYFAVERSAEYHHAQWALYSADDVGTDCMECFDGPDPLAPEYEYDLEPSAVELAEYDPEGGDFAAYEDDGSICWDEESVEEFLEGRALLQEWPRCVGLSGLAQAEMDVASRLRDHWRPLRLS